MAVFGFEVLLVEVLISLVLLLLLTQGPFIRKYGSLFGTLKVRNYRASKPSGVFPLPQQDHIQRAHIVKVYVSICWYPVFFLMSKRDDAKRRLKEAAPNDSRRTPSSKKAYWVCGSFSRLDVMVSIFMPMGLESVPENDAPLKSFRVSGRSPARMAMMPKLPPSTAEK